MEQARVKRLNICALVPSYAVDRDLSGSRKPSLISNFIFISAKTSKYCACCCSTYASPQ